MKYLLSNLIFFIICICLADHLAAQENITIIDSLLCSIITEDIQDPESNPGDTLSIINTYSDDELFRYCLALMTNQLQQEGFRVYRHNRIQNVNTGLIIELSRVSANILYSEPFSKNFLGSDFSNRTIRVQLSGQILDGESGALLKMIESDRLYQDEIKYNEIEELEGISFSFTQGERQKYSGWDRFIEPALVISSVVVIVLLFFTQRA
jgi:hypothetical protein